jgi:tRNA 2-thiouridine synthesizing protein C
MKRYLFIISRSPYGSSHALEQLEAAMVAAVFDAKVAVLFRDEGVWSLQQHQTGAAIGQKTMTKVLSALPAYDVEELYVCADFLNTHQIQTEPSLSVKPIDLPDQKALISASDVVVTAQP